jgi:myo-inositol-1(or 4)-monophosphatase
MTPAAMNDSELDRREAFCREIIRSAGAVARGGFTQRDVTTIAMKGPQDFLTETDGAVERHIRESVAREFPSDGFLGEETGFDIKDGTWVVDPIDGTANFARGIAHFCVAIAFVAGGMTRIGGTYNPVSDELYMARRGRGATLNGRPIAVSSTRRFDAACVELGWSTRVPNADYMRALGNILTLGANVRRSGSGALGLAYVADGRSDAYAELHMNAWDCLAGLLLVHEAGGVVADYPTDGGMVRGGAVLAAAPGIAAGISEATGIALHGHGREQGDGARTSRAS